MQEDFDIQQVLDKPLIAHLATICGEGPRSSPLWFLYEDQKIWLFGTEKDSFIKRLQNDPRAALSVVDFDLDSGILLHVGIRGMVYLHKVSPERLRSFVGKYLGYETEAWNKWFIKNIVAPLTVMVEVKPNTIVAKDVSFFKTGPDLAKE